MPRFCSRRRKVNTDSLCPSVAVTSIIRMQTLDFSSTSPDNTCKCLQITLKVCSRAYRISISPDDLTSSVWTILEENVAITCACLPMMWTPLARLFPSVFSMDSGGDSYGSAVVQSSEPRSAISQSGTNWTQLYVYPESKSSIGMNQIHDSQSRLSEESTGKILPSRLIDEAQDPSANGIRKVTEYQVSYVNASQVDLHTNNPPK
jgi:hypothetical protein